MENPLSNPIPCRDVTIKTILIPPHQVATASTGELIRQLNQPPTFVAIDSKPQSGLNRGEVYLIHCFVGFILPGYRSFKATFMGYEVFGDQTKANFELLVFINEEGEEVAEPQFA